MTLREIENYVWYANIAATLILASRLAFERLHRVYRFLFFYLITDAVQQVAGLAVTRLSSSPRRDYSVVYSVGQAAKVVLVIFVATELCRHGLAQHPALLRFSRRATVWVVGGAALVAVAALLMTPALAPGQPRMLHYFFSFERSIDAVSIILFLAIGLFMVWFPVRVPSNTAVYLAGFSAYVLARWVGILIADAYPGMARVISVVMLAFTLILLASGVLLLRREGERTTTVTGHRWNLGEIDRLTAQLDSINEKLTALERS